MQQGKSSGKASCRPHVKPAQVQMAVVQCAAVSQAKQVQFFSPFEEMCSNSHICLFQISVQIHESSRVFCVRSLSPLLSKIIYCDLLSLFQPESSECFSCPLTTFGFLSFSQHVMWFSSMGFFSFRFAQQLHL